MKDIGGVLNNIAHQYAGSDAASMTVLSVPGRVLLLAAILALLAPSKIAQTPILRVETLDLRPRRFALSKSFW